MTTSTATAGPARPTASRSLPTRAGAAIGIALVANLALVPLHVLVAAVVAVVLPRRAR